MPSSRLFAAAQILAVASLSAGSVQGPRFAPLQPDLSAAATLVNAGADYDGDGDVDLFVGANGTPNRLLVNTRGRLHDAAARAGVADARSTRAAAWGDYDADGDPDLLVGFAPAARPEGRAYEGGGGAASVLTLYRNDRARFADVTASAGIAIPSGAVRQASWVDVDADGDLDLYVGFRDRADVLFRNDGATFTDVAPAVGLADTRKTVGAVWFDYDEDGDLDLYAAHMDGDANALYRNDGGRFTDVAAAAGLAWGGRAANEPTNGTVRPCVADVDGNGRFDLFMANYGPNGLFLNRGGGRFEDVSAAWGVNIDGRYDTCAFSDIDHDGRIDLYVNGTVTGGVAYRDYLFRNTGSRFEEVTPDTLGALAADHGALWADFDGDGAEDLALTGAGPLPLVLRNMLPSVDARRSIRVRVTDARGRAIRAGAEVRVYQRGARQLLGARLVDSGSSYNAQSDVPLHFGIPSAGRVDVEVIWPGRSRTPVRSTGVTVPSSRTIVIRTLDGAGPPLPQRLSIAAGRDRCIQFSDVKPGADGYRECRVSEFGELGAVDGLTYFYALYCLIPSSSQDGDGSCGGGGFNTQYHRSRGMALFLRHEPEGLLEVAFERANPEIGLSVYQKPAIVHTPARTWLQLAIAVDGTGNGNESEYYLREAGRWAPVESQGWLKDLEKRVPADLEIRGGIWPDLTTLRAETGLYRPGDANCCPSGGVARIRLAVRKRQFVLTAVTFEPK
jgi:hypothetical protein